VAGASPPAPAAAAPAPARAPPAPAAPSPTPAVLTPQHSRPVSPPHPGTGRRAAGCAPCAARPAGSWLLQAPAPRSDMPRPRRRDARCPRSIWPRRPLQPKPQPRRAPPSCRRPTHLDPAWEGALALGAVDPDDRVLLHLVADVLEQLHRAQLTGPALTGHRALVGGCRAQGAAGTAHGSVRGASGCAQGGATALTCSR
jgi:hypothetical protein